jgi:hypothetical protein
MRFLTGTRDDPRRFGLAEEAVPVQRECRPQEVERLRRRDAFRREQGDLPRLTTVWMSAFSKEMGPEGVTEAGPAPDQKRTQRTTPVDSIAP